MKHYFNVSSTKSDKMLVKGIFCICIHAVLFKVVFTQCIGQPQYPGSPFYPANLPLVEGHKVPSFGPSAPLYGRVIGGNLIIDTSAPYSSIGPAGVTIFSDNLLIEGPVFVNGKLPFLGAVALEGILPATGISAVSYDYGNGNIGIIEGIPSTGPTLLDGGLSVPAGCNTLGFGRL